MRRFAAALIALLLAAPALAQDINNPQTNATALTTGTLPAGRLPALTGDVTSSAGSAATTLAAGSASNLNSGTLAAARGGAGTINGALAGNGSGVVSQAACAGLSNAGGYCSISAGQLTATLGGNVALTPQGTFSTTGPSVAQGATGTWFASGTITLIDSTATSSVACKLWDGTTVIDSGRGNIIGAGAYTTISLSGVKVSPAGNLRIDCVGLTTATSSMANNGSAAGSDSTITVFRIN